MTTFNVGDRVQAMNTGNLYSRYKHMADVLLLTNWTADSSPASHPINDFTVTHVASQHTTSKTIYVIKHIDGDEYIMGGGLQLIQEEDMSKFKIGDKIRVIAKVERTLDNLCQWVSEMDDLFGEQGIITAMNGGEISVEFKSNNTDWNYLPECLELVNQPDLSSAIVPLPTGSGYQTGNTLVTRSARRKNGVHQYSIRLNGVSTKPSVVSHSDLIPLAYALLELSKTG